MPRPRAAKQSTVLRRRQIAEAALRILGRRGAGALGVVALAREVGLAASALYRHFAGVEHVLDEVIRLLGERLLENAAAVCRQTPDALGRLRLLLDRHVALVRDNPGIPALVFSPDTLARRPRRRNLLYQAIRRYLAAVADMIADGQRAGTIRPDVSPRSAAMLFLGTVQPAAFLWHLGGRREPLQAQTDEMWSLVCGALSPRDGRCRDQLSTP